MTDYSKMSDFEINAAVGSATGYAMNSEPRLNIVIRNSNGRKFDPCKSWADAGPIIHSNRIGIREYDGWWEGRSYIPEHAICDKSPLRAAMIVFLMMKESK